MGRKRGIPGVSFSWKRAVGLSQAQSSVSRKTGIPLSRSGRQRKAGKLMGCCIPMAVLVLVSTVAATGLV